jgi:hypothetical protein
VDATDAMAMLTDDDDDAPHNDDLTISQEKKPFG